MFVEANWVVCFFVSLTKCPYPDISSYGDNSDDNDNVDDVDAEDGDDLENHNATLEHAGTHCELLG